MTGTRLVPTLAALVLAGGTLCASDGIAPVITLPVDTPVTASVDALEFVDPSGFDLSGELSDDIYVYSSSTIPHWQDLQTLGTESSAGIVVDTLDGDGQWEYGAPGSWTSVNVGDQLPLRGSVYEQRYLRFIPNPAATGGSANLTFRAWDGGTVDIESDGIGSPGPYSSETRTFTVTIVAANDAPVITDTDSIANSSISVAYGSSFTLNLSTSDADGDTVTWTSDAAHGTFDPVLMTYSPNDASPLSDVVTFTASDGNGGSSTIVVAFNNNAPTISVGTPPAYVQAGTSLDLSSFVTASDPDGHEITWSSDSVYASVDSTGHYLASAGGFVDTFNLTVTDPYGLEATQQVTLAVNTPPVISDPGGYADSTIRVRPGESIDLAAFGIVATDADPDTLVWSDGTTGYGSTTGLVYTANADADGMSDWVTFSVDDQRGGQATITISFRISSNDAPQLVSTTLNQGEGDDWFTVSQGGTATFSITLEDPDGDAITLDTQSEGYSLPYYGTLSSPVVTDDVETGARTFTFTYDHDGTNSDDDSMSLVFSDGHGNEWYSDITASVDPNSAPYLVTSLPGIAVRGRPYSALITIQDDEADNPITLATSELPPIEVDVATASLPSGNLPAGALVEVGSTIVIGGQHSSTTQRTYRLTFTPDTAGLVEFSLTTSDGFVESTGTYYISVADPIAATIDEPQIPISAPGSPIYAAIAPGSINGWSSLMSALQPHGADVARAWWWSTAGKGFADAEESPVSAARQPSTALFLASTVGLSYSFDARPYPMPFAIDLPPATAQAEGPGRDGWTFFGVPALWDGESTWTEHTLDDFVLETADGQRVDSEGEILNALAPSGDYEVQAPWSYDPALAAADRYQPASSMVTGRGYWIRNRSTTAYRLVRVASVDEAGGIRLSSITMPQGGARPAAVVGFTASAAAAEKPPAPPSGSKDSASSAAAGDGGSGCGVGGLASILVAGLALIGLGSRRRA